MTDTKFTPGPWVAEHRGTRTDIKNHTDYFRIGTELEVADPDAVCIHVYGARKAEKSAHIVKCVNEHEALHKRIAELSGALSQSLMYLEKIEGCIGETLMTGDSARNALGKAGAA